MRNRNYKPVLRIRIRIRSDPVFLGHPDPNPDPGKYRIRILYLQKDPCNLIFLVNFHCLKYSFVQRIFIFDFECHKMLRFGKKISLKNILILLNIKTYLGRIRFFLGPPDPKRNWTGSGQAAKNYKSPSPMTKNK